MDKFTAKGPFGEIECLVEQSRVKSDGVLVVSHGFRGSREGGGRAAAVARQCAECCDVVRFNFSGVRAMSSQVAELEAVIGAVRNLKQEPRLFLLGRSLGGAASVIAAAKDKDIEGLVLWATPNDLRGTFRHVMDPKDYLRLDRGESIFVNDERGECVVTPDFLTDFDKYDLSALLQSLSGRPVLVLHCDGDEIVPAKNAFKNAALAGEKCSLHVFKGGDHSFDGFSAKAGEIIAGWLGKRLRN